MAASLMAALLAAGCGSSPQGGGGPDFSLSGPSSMTVMQGSQTTGTVTVSAIGGFTGTVDLTVTSTLPSGVTAGFSPSSVSGSGNSTLTLTATTNATVGNSSFTVTGTSGSDVHHIPVGLTVQQSGGGGTNACSITTTTTLPGGQALFGDNQRPTTFLAIGLSIPVDCFTAQMSYYVTSQDTGGSANIYDIGLYCVSGSCNHGQLYVHTGPIHGSKFAPTTGQFTLPWTGVSQSNPVKLPAGLYAVAMGSQCNAGTDSCAQGRAEPGNGRIQPFATFQAGSFSSSGLPSSFTPPALSPQILAPKMVDFLIF